MRIAPPAVNHRSVAASFPLCVLVLFLCFITNCFSYYSVSTILHIRLLCVNKYFLLT